MLISGNYESAVDVYFPSNLLSDRYLSYTFFHFRSDFHYFTITIWQSDKHANHVLLLKDSLLTLRQVSFIYIDQAGCVCDKQVFLYIGPQGRAKIAAISDPLHALSVRLFPKQMSIKQWLLLARFKV